MSAGVFVPRVERDPEDASTVNLHVSLVVEVFDHEGMPIATLTVDENGYANPRAHLLDDMEAMVKRLPEVAADALDGIVQRAAWGDR